MPGQRGFTLLEVLIAVTVISLTLVCLAQLVTGSNRAAGQGEILAAAGELAEETLTQLLLHPDKADSIISRSRKQAMTRDWILTVAIRPCPDLPGMDLIRVTLSGEGLGRPLILARAVRHVP